MATRTFKPGEIVRVPFPYTDRTTRQRRPALVISATGVGEGARLVWLLMITAAANRGWPGDVDITESREETGLPIPSVIRAEKIATVETADVDVLGRITGATLQAARAVVDRLLGLP